jgi:hypothetical protein
VRSGTIVRAQHALTVFGRPLKLIVKRHFLTSITL